MTSTAAAMPSSGMDMGREKSLRNGSTVLPAAGAASLPRSFLIGLFRIWKGDSASLHAARATRPREHLRDYAVRRPFSAARVLVLWRRGAFTMRAGARGDPAVRAGRRVRRAAAAKCQTPLQRRRRQQPAAHHFYVARGSLSGVGATASRAGHQCFRRLGLTSCFVLWAPMPVARSRSAASI